MAPSARTSSLTIDRVLKSVCAFLILVTPACGKANEADHGGVAASSCEELQDDDGHHTVAIDNGVIRLSVDMTWGGAIRELSYAGENVVNSYDAGRLIGISLYDGASPVSLNPGDPDWGWNPTPSDKYDHENTPLAYSCTGGVLYAKSRSLQWNPDNKGGGRGSPVASDVVVETWIEMLASRTKGVRGRYRI